MSPVHWGMFYGQPFQRSWEGGMAISYYGRSTCSTWVSFVVSGSWTREFSNSLF
jgi:hypothetical protein